MIPKKIESIQLTDRQSTRLQELAVEAGVPTEKIAAVLMHWLLCDPIASDALEWAKEAAASDSDDPPEWFRG